MTTKRTPSPETLRKRAYNAFVDAEARFKKAQAKRDAADKEVQSCAERTMKARAECAKAGCPGFNPEHEGAAP